MKGDRFIVGLFGLAAFSASALLFALQPMCGKMVLPCLGGAPNVWTTCMLFFQGGLLAGYAYAYLGQRIGLKRFALFHCALLCLAALALFPWHGLACSRGAEETPAFWLLRALTTSIGLPYLLLASSAPLLQFCFSRSSHPRRDDPYFLYAASNAGSLLGLIGYPFLIERFLEIPQQAVIWSGGFVALSVLTVLAGMLTIGQHGSRAAELRQTPVAPQAVPTSELIGWLWLAFVPSSLMLSVTSHLSANLSAVPILWLVPLSIYLVTYMLAFSPRLRIAPPAFWARWLPGVALVVVLLLVSEGTEPLWLIVALHIVGLFWIGLLCHTELARARPGVHHLTKFYLCIAVGGALGGLFNALIAPALFNDVWEYPIALVLACLVRQRRSLTAEHAKVTRLDWLLPIGLACATVIVITLVERSGMPAGAASAALIFGVPLVVCYSFLARPVRFGLGVAALLIAATFYHGAHGASQKRVRSFFGVHRITLDRENRFRLLVHGNTEHGRQSLDARRKSEPLAYYHRSGPVGDIFGALRSPAPRVAVVGLGAGTVAAYARRGERWTFYEIDRAVVHIARDPRCFSYLTDAMERGAELTIVVGDGRLKLAESSEHYDLILLDAFGSDSIPLHLLTAEALAIYRSRLAPDGFLAFHYSSRYLDLQPILARLALSAEPWMSCLFREDIDLGALERAHGKAPSKWALMTAAPPPEWFFGGSFSRWNKASEPMAGPLWTDHSADLLDALEIF